MYWRLRGVADRWSYLPARSRTLLLTTLVLQALVFALRCWRYHVETCRRDLVLRATRRELVLDAMIWGLLHAFILSSLPAASSLFAQV